MTLYDPYEDKETVVTYKSGKSIYRMQLDGGEPQEIVSDLGNGQAHLHLDTYGRGIWYTTCYEGLFPYHTVTFNRCTRRGDEQTLLVGTENPSDRNARRAIVEGLMIADWELYALVSDSEGDTAHGRIMHVSKNGVNEQLDNAAYGANPVEGGSGSLYLLRAEDEDGTGEGRLQLIGRHSDGEEMLWEAAVDLKPVQMATMGYAKAYFLTDDAIWLIDVNKDEPQLCKIADLPVPV